MAVGAFSAWAWHEPQSKPGGQGPLFAAHALGCKPQAPILFQQYHVGLRVSTGSCGPAGVSCGHVCQVRICMLCASLRVCLCKAGSAVVLPGCQRAALFVAFLHLPVCCMPTRPSIRGRAHGAWSGALVLAAFGLEITPQVCWCAFQD